MREETTCKPDYSNSMAEHLGIRFMPSATDEVRAEMPVLSIGLQKYIKFG